MIRRIEHARTEAQRERQAAVVDLLKDGPKRSKHIAQLLGIETGGHLQSRLVTLFSRFPVYYDDDEDRWYLNEQPHIPHPIQKKFRFPGSPLIRGMHWNGIGGIQALWTSGQ